MQLNNGSPCFFCSSKANPWLVMLIHSPNPASRRELSPVVDHLPHGSSRTLGKYKPTSKPHHCTYQPLTWNIRNRSQFQSDIIGTFSHILKP